MERGGPCDRDRHAGLGRSDRPDPARFDYSMYGLSAFLERCLDELGVGRRKLVVHDWGGLALIGAQRRPELVERLVVINAVPLLPGYRWHWIAQIWRRRPLGELVQRDDDPRRRWRCCCARPRRPQRDAAGVRRHDLGAAGTRGPATPILALYRHADPDRLAEAGRDLGRLACPALVVWGERDLYLPTKFAQAFADALPDSELELVAGRRPLALDRRRAGDRPRPRFPRLSVEKRGFLRG